MTDLQCFPVAVIGAGPVGLAAAAHLATRKLRFIVLEPSDGVSASFRDTAHVRLFSPMKLNVDPLATSLLESHGWQAPDPCRAECWRALYPFRVTRALELLCPREHREVCKSLLRIAPSRATRASSARSSPGSASLS
jgi:2-polyprenyl-6-methoxyphenol hydroxylase-like FAD-dependent oxidoreductase